MEPRKQAGEQRAFSPANKRAVLYGIMAEYRDKLGREKFTELKQRKRCFNCFGDPAICGGAAKCTKSARLNLISDEDLHMFNSPSAALLIEAGLTTFGEDLLATREEDDESSHEASVHAILAQLPAAHLSMMVTDEAVNLVDLPCPENRIGNLAPARQDDPPREEYMHDDSHVETARVTYMQAGSLIHANLEWNGHTLPIMIDSGATITCISAAAAEELGLTVEASALRVTLGTGRTHATGTVTLNEAYLDTAFGMHAIASVQAHVIPGLSLPFILGMDIMSKEDIVIEPGAGIIYHASHKRDAMPNASMLVALDDTPQDGLFHITLPEFFASDTSDHGEPDVEPPRSKLYGDAIALNDDPHMQALVKKYASVFNTLQECPPRRGEFDATIEMLPGAKPHFSPNRAKSREDREHTEAFMNEWIRRKNVYPDNKSGWTAPIHFPPKPKKDGKKRETWDCRKNNASQKLCQYPMPDIRLKINELAHSKYFTLFDFPSAFHQQRLAPGHEQYMILATPIGNYASRISQMGMKNSAQHFQKLVDAILKGTGGALPRYEPDHPRFQHAETIWREHSTSGFDDLTSFASAYLDDVVVHSRSLEEHRQHVEKVLERFATYGILVKAITQFGAQAIDYLGHRIHDGRVTPLESKMEALRTWPLPTTTKEMRTFLGVANFYRQHVPSMARWTALLTPYTRGEPKDSITLSEAAQNALSELKHALANAAELRLPDTEREFIVVTDASIYAIGGALLQRDDNDNLHVLAYYSRQTTLAESKYGQYKLELLALCASLRHWNTQLTGRKIIAYTDHKPLVTGDILHELNGYEPTGRVMRLLTDVQHLQVDLRHHPADAPLAKHVDALTRRPDFVTHAGRDLQAWISSLEQHIKCNPTCAPTHVVEPTTRRVTTITPDDDATEDAPPPHAANETPPTNETPPPQNTADPSTTPGATLLDRFTYTQLEETAMRKRGYVQLDSGLWTHAGRYVVPDIPDLRNDIIADAHANGHPGIQATTAKLQERFTWTGMHADIRAYINQCATCATTKRSNRRPAPTLPRVPPSTAWTEIELDFIDQLPNVDGHDRILTVVDTYSKHIILVPCSQHMTADQFTDIFITNVWAKHGMPKIIRTDCDRILLARAWETIATRMDVDHTTTTPYRHEALGTAERMNQTVEQTMRTLAGQDVIDTTWPQIVPFVEFFVNSTASHATGMPPFAVSTHRMPRIGWGFDDIERLATDATPDLIDDIHEYVQDKLRKNEREYAGNAPLTTFAPGDWVYLSTEHLTTGTLGSLAQDPRFRSRFIGPFRVQERLGLRTYKLGIPPGVRIRNQFDVDRLRRAHRPTTTEVDLVDGEVAYDIESIVRLHGRRVDNVIYNDRAVIRWRGYDEQYDTIHPLVDIIADAPTVVTDYIASLASRPRFTQEVEDALDQL